MIRVEIDRARGTITVGEYVYSLDVLARGAVRPVAPSKNPFKFREGKP